MTDQGSTPQVDDLLKQGIAAARAGNKAEARTLLEQVVESDQHNEKGWFWLAAVTDDIDEKRVCLGNVIVINPDNARAKRLLEQLESGSATTPAAPVERAALMGGSDGVGRRPVYLAVGLGAAAVIILLIVLVVLLSGGGNKKEPTPNPTQAAFNSQQPTQNNPPTQVPASQNNNQADQTTPADSAATPLPTITSTAPPATWTPVPTFTLIPVIPPTVFPPPPSGLPGEILMRSGQVPGDPNNQPIVLIRPDGSSQRTVTPGTTRGHAPVFSPDASRYAFIMYAPGTREYVLELNSMQGTEERIASKYWTGAPALQEQNSPTWSPDGNWIAFSARGLGSATDDLYRVSLANPNGDASALERLTTDDAIESWPSYSPDGRRIVYAVDLQKLEFNAPTELRIYDLSSGQITDLTNNGTDLIEAAPDWSPDGMYIVFQAHESGSAQNDIYRISASGVGPAEKIIESDADDIQPRYSPDGRYIVFSSNRAGNWDVYIYTLTTGETYQLTTSPYTDIANDWGR